MFRHVPNALTGSRLVLAFIFFALLSYYQYEGRGYSWSLNVAFVIYVIALVTDFLDGYLARKWKVEGAFGRIVDPFVDKILVLGSFIFFAGKNFIIPSLPSGGERYVVQTITGVYPWIVVLLLGRELLVTSLRGAAEASGESFGAVWAGKVKMGFQSGTILAILIYVSFQLDELKGNLGWIVWGIRQFGIYGTVVITLYSGLQYIQKAIVLFRSSNAVA